MKKSAICAGIGLVVRCLGIVLALACFQAPAQLLTNCTQAALQAAIGSEGGIVALQGCAVNLSAPLVISTEIVLNGIGTNASSLNASNRSRIFVVEAGGRLLVNNLTLSGGRDVTGGAVMVRENAEAIFTNCVFTANSAVGPEGTEGFNGPDYSGIGGNGQPGMDGTNGLGGAVFNWGNVTFLACRFTGNSATGGSGGNGGKGGAGGYQGGNGGRGGNGATGRGGAVYNAGTAFFRDTTLERNTAKGGAGGAGGEGGTGPEAGVTGSGGAGAMGAGAAIFNSGDLQIVNCTFVTNTATGGNSASDGSLNGGLVGGNGFDGGAALGGALCNVSSGNATNCTFSQNAAIGGAGGDGGDGRFEAGNGGNGGQASGGAIYSSGVQWLINCTLSQNRVAGGTNGVAGTGPQPGNNGKRGMATGATVFGTTSGQFYYKNTIFAYGSGSTNGTGGLTGIGNNISSDSSVPLGPNSFRRDPKLYELANNGGPTWTMMLQATSVAANAGDMDGAPDFDQRGLPRPSTADDAPDIGAVEVQPPAITNQPASFMVPLGSNATFTVGVRGDFPFVYRWLRNGTNVPGATAASLTISNVTASAVGQYSVIVSNAAGIVQSQPAFLSIGSAIVITNQPVSRTVAPGVDVTFTVGATGTPPLSVQWRSNAVPIATATNWTLLLQNVQTNYAADYTARITNAVGAVVSDIARLIVTPPTSLNGVAVSGTNLTVAFPTQTGVTYVTEFKNTLSASNWIPVATNVGAGVVLTNFYPATVSPSGFYRVKAQ